MASFSLLSLVFGSVLCLSNDDYASPLREWQSGVFRGNPQYSPIGPFNNYTIVFRANDGFSAPPDYLLFETALETTQTIPVITNSYQQWSIVASGVTYCGLITYDQGATYGYTLPTLVYEPQRSSQNDVVFCADP